MTSFYILGAIAIVASLLVIGQKNPIYSVLLLIGSFGALSGLYVLLDAPFVAVIQIIVYAGAIMVLFLFVVMLLNAPHEETVYDEQRHLVVPPGSMRFGALLAIGLVVELTWALSKGGETGVFGRAMVSRVDDIGQILFTDYAFPFEVTSILILVAMVGAVVLARRDPRLGDRGSQRSSARDGEDRVTGEREPSARAGGGGPAQSRMPGPASIGE